MYPVRSILLCICFSIAISENLQNSYNRNNNYLKLEESTEPSVEKSYVTLKFYNNGNITNTTLIQYEDVPNLEEKTSYNRSLNTVIYIHGWLDSCNFSNDAMRTAFLTYRNVNYFELCWEKYSWTEYLISRSLVKDVAKYFQNYLTAMESIVNLDFSSLTLVGHSLGAHVAGIASKSLNSSVGFIVGLDAAGPGVFEFQTDRLTSDSAIYVQAIHTDSSFLGINFDVGNADFWPNSGRSQPGCGGVVFGLRCSHLRSIEYYAESVKSGNFSAKLCDTYDDYEKGKCNENLEKSMGGYPLDPTIVGGYYLETNSSSPYALGHHDPSKL